MTTDTPTVTVETPASDEKKTLRLPSKTTIKHIATAAAVVTVAVIVVKKLQSNVDISLDGDVIVETAGTEIKATSK